MRGGVEGVVGTLATDLRWYPSGLLIRTRPLPQTGIGGKNDHVVDQLGLTYCRKDGLVGVLPAPATLPCSEALPARHHPLTNRTRGNRSLPANRFSPLSYGRALLRLALLSGPPVRGTVEVPLVIHSISAAFKHGDDRILQFRP